jgi:hypothetical protein
VDVGGDQGNFVAWALSPFCSFAWKDVVRSSLADILPKLVLPPPLSHVTGDVLFSLSDQSTGIFSPVLGRFFFNGCPISFPYFCVPFRVLVFFTNRLVSSKMERESL